MLVKQRTEPTRTWVIFCFSCRHLAHITKSASPMHLSTSSVFLEIKQSRLHLALLLTLCELSIPTVQMSMSLEQSCSLHSFSAAPLEQPTSTTIACPVRSLSCWYIKLDMPIASYLVFHENVQICESRNAFNRIRYGYKH